MNDVGNFFGLNCVNLTHFCYYIHIDGIRKKDLIEKRLILKDWNQETNKKKINELNGKLTDRNSFKLLMLQ